MAMWPPVPEEAALDTLRGPHPVTSWLRDSDILPNLSVSCVRSQKRCYLQDHVEGSGEVLGTVPDPQEAPRKCPFLSRDENPASSTTPGRRAESPSPDLPSTACSSLTPPTPTHRVGAHSSSSQGGLSPAPPPGLAARPAGAPSPVPAGLGLSPSCLFPGSLSLHSLICNVHMDPPAPPSPHPPPNGTGGGTAESRDPAHTGLIGAEGSRRRAEDTPRVSEAPSPSPGCPPSIPRSRSHGDIDGTHIALPPTAHLPTTPHQPCVQAGTCVSTNQMRKVRPDGQ